MNRDHSKDKEFQRKRKSLSKMIKDLPDADINELDLKTLILTVVEDIDGDSAQHFKVKIEALRLLHDIIKKDNVGQDGNMSEDNILHLLNGTKG